MKLSICIPTYQRAGHLRNCLHSLAQCRRPRDLELEVVVSDNGSADDTTAVVQAAMPNLPLRYRRNDRNLGLARNFLQVVEAATGDFAWLLGDDDLLLEDALERLAAALRTHNSVDFIFANSCHLSADYLKRFPSPFDSRLIPADLPRFSTWQGPAHPIPFLSLIDPDVSFDYLGGMFLAIFRREKWLNNVGVLRPDKIDNLDTFSDYDNTFPHVKIFAAAFAQSAALFIAEPVSVNLSGVREWAPMYPLVRSVRLIESLGHFRAQGLPLGRYLRCRNAGLAYILPDLLAMCLNPTKRGLRHARFVRDVLANLPYPNFYLSGLRFGIRRLRRLLAWPPRLTQKAASAASPLG